MDKLQDKIVKDAFIKIRVSIDEKAKINELAKSCNQKQSEYARARLLGYKADNNRKLELQVKSQALANQNTIARQIVKYPNNIDKLLLLEALNSIEEKLSG